MYSVKCDLTKISSFTFLLKIFFSSKIQISSRFLAVDINKSHIIQSVVYINLFCASLILINTLKTIMQLLQNLWTITSHSSSNSNGHLSKPWTFWSLVYVYAQMCVWVRACTCDPVFGRQRKVKGDRKKMGREWMRIFLFFTSYSCSCLDH